MSVGQVFSVFSLLCNKYPLPDINSCYRYRVLSDIRTADYTWRFRCCPKGYVFEDCKCRQSIPGFVYDPVRKVYNQESIESERFLRNFRTFDDANALYERRWDPRRERIVHATYTLQAPRIVRRLRPVITVPSAYLRPEIIGTPFVRPTKFRKNFPRKPVFRRVFPKEQIPSIDLQGISKADQFQLRNPEENFAVDSNIEANPTDLNNILEPLSNSKNVKEKQSQKHQIVGSRQTGPGAQDILTESPEFLDTSIYADGNTLSSTKTTDFMFDHLKLGDGAPNYDQYIDTSNEGNSLYLQDVTNAFSLKEVLANMKLYQDKYNEQKFKKMKKLNKISKPKKVLSESSIDLSGQEDILNENGKSNTNHLSGENKISRNQSIAKETKASAFYKTDRIVTITEEEMNGKNNMPGNDTVVEINGIGNGHSNYTVEKKNNTFGSSLLKNGKYSIADTNVDARVNNSQNGVISNEPINGPSMTINLDSNTTMTIPLIKEGADGELLQDAIMKSTVEAIPTSENKSSDSFTVINVPVKNHHNSIVKGITFKVPTKVGKFFKLMTNKDSIDL